MQNQGAAGVGRLEIDLGDRTLRRWVQSHLELGVGLQLEPSDNFRGGAVGGRGDGSGHEEAAAGDREGGGGAADGQRPLRRPRARRRRGRGRVDPDGAPLRRCSRRESAHSTNLNHSQRRPDPRATVPVRTLLPPSLPRIARFSSSAPAETNGAKINRAAYV